jgi:hypothetical protein
MKIAVETSGIEIRGELPWAKKGWRILNWDFLMKGEKVDLLVLRISTTSFS